MVKHAWALLLFVAAPAAATSADLLLEAELEPSRVAVQTQATYRLRLYQAVAVRDLVIGEPQSPLAEFRPIGAPRIDEAVRDGRRYRVHERRYAVIPFASGNLAIAGVGASARIAAPAGWRELRVAAPPLTLAVLPLPADAGVAARSLRLQETWSTAADGSIWRRLIRIEAAGIDAAQLPEIRFAVPGANVHAEPARLDNHYDGDINVGVREQSFNVAMQRADDIVVPELRLAWSRADTLAPEAATLPARVLKAPAAVPAGGDASVMPPALMAVAALGLAAALAWRRRRRLQAAWRLHRACRTGEPAAVRDALLAWAAAVRGEHAPLTLGALAAGIEDGNARAALAELDRSLYGAERGRRKPALAGIVKRAKRGLR